VTANLENDQIKAAIGTSAYNKIFGSQTNVPSVLSRALNPALTPDYLSLAGTILADPSRSLSAIVRNLPLAAQDIMAPTVLAALRLGMLVGNTTAAVLHNLSAGQLVGALQAVGAGIQGLGTFINQTIADPATSITAGFLNARDDLAVSVANSKSYAPLTFGTIRNTIGQLGQVNQSAANMLIGGVAGLIQMLSPANIANAAATPASATTPAAATTSPAAAPAPTAAEAPAAGAKPATTKTETALGTNPASQTSTAAGAGSTGATSATGHTAGSKSAASSGVSASTDPAGSQSAPGKHSVEGKGAAPDGGSSSTDSGTSVSPAGKPAGEGKGANSSGGSDSTRTAGSGAPTGHSTAAKGGGKSTDGGSSTSAAGTRSGGGKKAATGGSKSAGGASSGAAAGQHSAAAK
jgi:hypothetical protein